MATIFKPRRTDQSKANTNSTVLSNGEMLISYIDNTDAATTNTTNRHNIYFGDGSTQLKNLSPSVYGDTSIEPLKTLWVPPSTVTTTSKCLNYVRAGNKIGLCIGALKKAIYYLIQEQDNWYSIPQTRDRFFINEFDNFKKTGGGYYDIDDPAGSTGISLKLDTDSASPMYNHPYIDLSGLYVPDNPSNPTSYHWKYTEIYIKATIVVGTAQIVIPITVPRERLYNLKKSDDSYEVMQSFRSGYWISPPDPNHGYPNGIGAAVAFKICKERVYFDQASINGTTASTLRWAFTWKEREHVDLPT